MCFCMICSKCRGKDVGKGKWKKSKAVTGRDRGIFGKITAYFGVSEGQGRGSLHFHMALGGSTTCYDLILCRSIRVRDAATLHVINKHVQSQLPLKSTLPVVLARNGEWGPKMKEYPFPLVRPIKWAANRGDTDANTMAAILNNHEHCETCRHGKVGNQCCRLAMPRGDSSTAEPQILLLRKRCQQSIETPVGSEFRPSEKREPIPLESTTNIPKFSSSTAFCYDNPLPGPDQRPIVLELPRPPIEIDALIEGVRDIIAKNKNGSGSSTEPGFPFYSPNAIAFLEELCQRTEGGSGSDGTTQEQQHKDRLFWEELQSRNIYLSEFNAILTSCLGCNTNVQHIGTESQAKGVLMFLWKYAIPWLF